MTSPVPGHDVPTGEQPGAGSTPADEGDGTVGLADRTAGGAPAANQTKVEPVPPTPGHTAPDVASGPVGGLDPDELRIGAADPQAPSHPAGGRRPDHGSSYDEAVVEDGTAQRARGSQGVPAEPIGSDHDAAAVRMRPAEDTSTSFTSAGDARGVPVAAQDAAEGTSETASSVQGVRTPQE